jgi:hypothetical protein
VPFIWFRKRERNKWNLWIPTVDEWLISYTTEFATSCSLKKIASFTKIAERAKKSGLAVLIDSHSTHVCWWLAFSNNKINCLLLPLFHHVFRPCMARATCIIISEVGLSVHQYTTCMFKKVTLPKVDLVVLNFSFNILPVATKSICHKTIFGTN